MEKRCSKCGAIKLLTEFYRNRAKPDGHQDQCKVCFAETTKASRERHIEKRREVARKTAQDYRARIGETAKQRSREWYKTKGKDWHRAYQEAHAEQTQSAKKRYRVTHRETERAAVNRYRARLQGLREHHTQDEWEQLREKYNHRCLACGDECPLTRDHVIPIVKGGIDTIDNIQPLCKPCNSRKGLQTTDYRR